MRDDLLDAQAAIDWAVAQIPRLHERIAVWAGSNPYVLVEEPHPEAGKNLIKLRDVKPLPAIINAEVGAIINSTRSSLDLLAASLALRNGVTPHSDTHFPIFRGSQCAIDPIDGIDGSKCKKWLSERERAIIKTLKPYPTGDDTLFALHQLDILRKHTRLVDVHIVPTRILTWQHSGREGLQFPPMWHGFKDNAVIAWRMVDGPKGQFQIALDVSFNEAGLVPSKPIVPTLGDFASTAQDIIKLFDI